MLADLFDLTGGGGGGGCTGISGTKKRNTTITSYTFNSSVWFLLTGFILTPEG